MMKRLTAAALAATLLTFSVGSQAQADPYLQCVTFARMITGIQIFGDAWTWWSKAVGHYQTGKTPETGAVLVFRPTGRMRLGHVAVVSQVLTDRIIQITHANWSPYGGTRGKVEHEVTVVDVSPKGDWSLVKVWYNPIGDLGKTVYPTYGFIYQAAKSTGAHLMTAQGPQNTSIGVKANP
jgi:surface antigen